MSSIKPMFLMEISPRLDFSSIRGSEKIHRRFQKASQAGISPVLNSFIPHGATPSPPQGEPLEDPWAWGVGKGHKGHPSLLDSTGAIGTALRPQSAHARAQGPIQSCPQGAHCFHSVSQHKCRGGEWDSVSGRGREVLVWGPWETLAAVG